MDRAARFAVTITPQSGQTVTCAVGESPFFSGVKAGLSA